MIVSKHKDYPLRLTSTAQFYQAVLASNSYAQCIKTLSDLNCFDFFAGDDCSPFSMVQYCHSEEGARLKEWLNDTLHVRALADTINSIEEFNWVLSAIDPCTEVRGALVECLYNKYCSTAKKNTSVKVGLFSQSSLTTDSCITKLCLHYESNQHAKVSTGDQSTRYRKFLDSLEEAIPVSSLRINKTT